VEKTKQVIAVGGGAVTDQRNVERLRSAGRIVWLTATPEVLWQRVKADPRSASTRPDLGAGGGLEEVRTLLAARQPGYGAAADLTIDTTRHSAARTADMIVASLGSAGVQ
jgi:shikimate kinase